MGQLVFIRLLFHHLCGCLRGLAELKMRLSTYLGAIKNQKNAYESYPGVLLCFQTMVSVGELVIGPYSDYKSLNHVRHYL